MEFWLAFVVQYDFIYYVYLFLLNISISSVKI